MNESYAHTVGDESSEDGSGGNAEQSVTNLSSNVEPVTLCDSKSANEDNEEKTAEFVTTKVSNLS